ncbi:hypothetical protein UYO_1833 [Lachnospiraceae bacterium JC7]|nr:hypothetical protein UYO_1833 [Lachnospiraceae bacterium JC7]
MGLFSDHFSEEHPFGVISKMFGSGNEKEEQQVVKRTYNVDPLVLYNISGEEIKELQPEDRVYVRKDDATKKITVETSASGGKSTVITACDISANENDQRELTAMLNTLVEDISRARRNGADGITVPVNEYELVAYIRNRPSIEIDLDRLEEAINQGQRDDVLTDFVGDLHKNKRVDVYTSLSNIYNVEATHILKDEFKNFSNIHFYELNANLNSMIYWNDETIVNNMKYSPEAIIIGIGLAGEKPQHAISIKNDIHSSVVRKAAIMVNHPMNVREEMLDAQFVDHAIGIEEIAKRRNMSEEVKNKVLIELAVAEARYRYDELRINDFLKSAINVFYTEGQMKLIKVPFDDEKLIRNLIPDAMTGLLVEVADSQIIFYGSESSAKLLIEKYQWSDLGYGRAGHDTTRQTMRQYEKQVSDMTVRSRFISETNKVLIENEGRSASASYKSVRDLAQKFNDIGLDAENQIELLREVPVINDPNYRVSIENIIKETLTKESPFRMFGEIRKGARPRRRTE